MHLNRIIPKVVEFVPEGFDKCDIVELLALHQIEYEEMNIIVTDEI